MVSEHALRLIATRRVSGKPTRAASQMHTPSLRVVVVVLIVLLLVVVVPQNSYQLGVLIIY